MQILHRGNHPARPHPPFPKLMHTGLIIRGRAATLNFYAAQWRNHHLLFTMEPIQQQKYPQLKVSFYECLQDDQLRVSVIVVLTPADELKNRK